MKKLLLIAAIAFTLTACSKDEETDPNTKYCVECQSKFTMKYPGSADLISNTETKLCGLTISEIDMMIKTGNSSTTVTSGTLVVTQIFETTCAKKGSSRVWN